MELDKRLASRDQEQDLLGASETQSVCERNTNSVGKLVHELVTIYGLCGDSLKVVHHSSYLYFYQNFIIDICMPVGAARVST